MPAGGAEIREVSRSDHAKPANRMLASVLTERQARLHVPETDHLSSHRAMTVAMCACFFSTNTRTQLISDTQMLFNGISR